MTTISDSSVILSEAQRSRRSCGYFSRLSAKLRVPHPCGVFVFVARVGNHKSKLAFFSLATLLTLTACRPHDFPQYPPNFREYAYITNGGSGTVTILDVVNVRLDRELPVGRNPVAVTASPTRHEVYVVNSGAEGGQGSVSVINAENNTVAAAIPVHRQPVSIDL